MSKLRNQKYGDSVVRDLVNFKNEEKIISCSDDGSVSLWNIESGENLHYLKCHSAAVNSICLMNSKRTLLSGGKDNKIIVYDLDQTGVFQKKAELKDYYSVEKISSFHNNTNFAVACTSDGMIKVWNINKKE